MNTSITLELGGFSSRTVRSIRALIVAESQRIDEQLKLTRVETDEAGVRVGLRRASGALMVSLIVCDRIAPPFTAPQIREDDAITVYAGPKGSTRVKLGKKWIGEIRYNQHGYRYHPRGAKIGGECFRTLAACVESLGPE